MRTTNSTLDILVNSCTGFLINVSDTFCYACSDSEQIDNEDMEELIPYLEDYGHNILIAYVAVLREIEPLPILITDAYTEAKAKILELKNAEIIMFYETHERKTAIELSDKIGLYEWSYFIKKDKDGIRYRWNKIVNDKGMVAVGTTGRQVTTRMINKMEKLK